MITEPNEELHRLIVKTINTGLYIDAEKMEISDIPTMQYIANYTNGYDLKEVLKFITESIDFRNKASMYYTRK